jgi:hypothetical protein
MKYITFSNSKIGVNSILMKTAIGRDHRYHGVILEVALLTQNGHSLCGLGENT